jgi:hypothetical protein
VDLDGSSFLAGDVFGVASVVLVILLRKGWWWYLRICRRCLSRGGKNCYCMGGAR